MTELAYLLSRRRFLTAAGSLFAASALAGQPSQLLAATGSSDLPVPLQEADGDWQPTFIDGFDDPVSFNKDWRRMRNGGNEHKTMRYPKNVVVQNSEMDLKLGQQDDPKRPFTGGYVETRTFRQCYGYFECDMRIASEPGVNNAFWLVSDRKMEKGTGFELDVVEAKYPNKVLVVARLWRPEKKVLAGRHNSNVRLDQGFHLYGMLWTAERFRFFFDDMEVFDAPNEFAHSPALMRFSNAVAPFAGKNDGDVRGAATSVRGVRVYQNLSA